MSQGEKKVFGVSGAGTMGAGIAYAAAAAGYRVVLTDINEDATARGLSAVHSFVEKGLAREKISEEIATSIRESVSVSTDVDSFAGATIVVEAIVEDLEIKRSLFRAIEAVVPDEAILATNTSSLSVTEIASALEHPNRFIGMHFFNPAHIMKLVEVVRGFATDPEVVVKTIEISKELGKVPVTASDTPGFIVNRVARNFYGEALKIVGEGGASYEQVDSAMKGLGFRMGPFELMDLIGIDINYSVTQSVHGQFYGEPRFRPHLIQKGMVDSGKIGRKAGGGFYPVEKK